MPPDPSFTVSYTDEIVREAVRAFVLRRFVAENKGFWIAGAATAGLVAYLVWTGDRSWAVGLFGVAAALPAVMLLAGWRAHYSNTVGRFRRMKTPEARFTLREDGLAIAGEDGDATVKWPAITDVWERERVWIVFLAPNQFFLLPTEGVPAEALDVFRRRTRTAQ